MLILYTEQQLKESYEDFKHNLLKTGLSVPSLEEFRDIFEQEYKEQYLERKGVYGRRKRY